MISERVIQFKRRRRRGETCTLVSKLDAKREDTTLGLGAESHFNIAPKLVKWPKITIVWKPLLLHSALIKSLKISVKKHSHSKKNSASKREVNQHITEKCNRLFSPLIARSDDRTYDVAPTALNNI